MKKSYSARTKIFKFKDLKKLLRLLKGKNIVLVGGCFDILHYGHLIFLKNAKKEGELLVVLLESDEFIRKRKNRIPVHNQDQRVEMLSSIEIVDFVITLPFLKSDKDYFGLVESMKPKIIAVSKGDQQLENKKMQAKKVGAKLKVVTDVLEKFSTSNIFHILQSEL